MNKKTIEKQYIGNDFFAYCGKVYYANFSHKDELKVLEPYTDLSNVVGFPCRKV